MKLFTFPGKGMAASARNSNFTFHGKSAILSAERRGELCNPIFGRKAGKAVENYFQMNRSRQQIDAISNLGLAHLGDAVFEVLCRAYLCARGNLTVGRLHKDTVSLVRAPAQAAFADQLLPLLTEDELAYYRRGKNSHVHAVPKGATAQEYAKATGVEALFGALYLAGQTERANELFNLVMEALYGI